MSGKTFSKNCFKLDSEQTLNSISGESRIVNTRVWWLSALLANIVLILCTLPDSHSKQTSPTQPLPLSSSQWTGNCWKSSSLSYRFFHTVEITWTDQVFSTYEHFPTARQLWIKQAQFSHCFIHSNIQQQWDNNGSDCWILFFWQMCN